jgi:hypothetical protein
MQPLKLSAAISWCGLAARPPHLTHDSQPFAFIPTSRFSSAPCSLPTHRGGALASNQQGGILEARRGRTAHPLRNRRGRSCVTDEAGTEQVLPRGDQTAATSDPLTTVDLTSLALRGFPCIDYAEAENL